MFMKYTFYLIALFSLCLVACESNEARRDRFFQMGNQALAQEDFLGAVELYNESLEVDPRYAFALNNRGVAKMESDHPYEAILDYTQAILLVPGYVDALFNRAYAYESVGKYEQSLQDVDILLDVKQDSAFIHFYKGLVLTKMKRYDQAFESFVLADSLNPFNVETIINKATIHYFRQDYDQASEELSKAFELNLNDADAINLQSLIQLKKKKYLAALVEINRALDEVPDEPYFLNNRGFVYLQMDSIDLAIRDIDRSILLNPKNGWAYRNKGIYFMRKQDYSQAIRLFKRALDEPEFIDEVYYYLGLAYKNSGAIDQACEAWKKGAELNETSSIQVVETCD